MASWTWSGLARQGGFALLVVAGCERSPGEVCAQAVARHQRCVTDEAWWMIPRPSGDAPEPARPGDVVERCVADPGRVAAYRRCLAITACDAYLRCTAAAVGRPPRATP